MSFDWGNETYTEGGGGDFLSEEETLRFVVSGEAFAITAIREGRSAQYNKDQWLVDFLTNSGEEKTRGFTKGNSERDDRISRLKKTLEETGEPIQARLIKVGRRYDVAGA